MRQQQTWGHYFQVLERKPLSYLIPDVSETNSVKCNTAACIESLFNFTNHLGYFYQLLT